jgi:transcriptional regulator with XRE-family HTH domain
VGTSRGGLGEDYGLPAWHVERYELCHHLRVDAPEPNECLRRARERVESSQTPGESLSRQELAELVNARVFERAGRVVELDANYVGKLERGQIRWPQADYRAGLRAVLGAGTDRELGFRRSRRSPARMPDLDRKDFLRAALGVGAALGSRRLAELITPAESTPIPSVVGQTEVDQVRTAARMFGTWDHTYGGGLVREAVAAQLRYSTELLNARCPERLRGELYSAVGFLSHTSGFMAFDAYAHNDARRMFRVALACAEECEDCHLRAKVLSSVARQAIWCGDPDSGLTLVELALVRADRLTPTERAMLLSARARALAKLGLTQPTATTVGMADEEFSNSHPADDPVWMRYYDQAQHAGDTGHALFDLAMNRKFVSEATSRLATAVASHTDVYARSRAISATKLASLIMVTGDPVEAVAVGTRAIADAGTVRSRRAADDLRELRRLATRHQPLAEVAELQQRINRMLSTS